MKKTKYVIFKIRKFVIDKETTFSILAFAISHFMMQRYGKRQVLRQKNRVFNIAFRDYKALLIFPTHKK